MTKISEPITLDKLWPLIQKLSQASKSNCVNSLKQTQTYGGKNGKNSARTSMMPLPIHRKTK